MFKQFLKTLAQRRNRQTCTHDWTAHQKNGETIKSCDRCGVVRYLG